MRFADVQFKNSSLLQEPLDALRDGLLDMVVIRGIPQKNLEADMPTPSDRRNPAGINTATEEFIQQCAELMAIDLRANPKEDFPFNDFFHHVIPQQEYMTAAAVNNGAGNFPLHQDRVFLENIPHFHFLAGIRVGNDPTPTVFVDTDHFMADIPDNLSSALSKREYQDKAGQKLVSIIRSDSLTGERYMVADLQEGWMNPTTESAGEALNRIRKISRLVPAHHRKDVLINAGDLVIHNHRKLMHGRESFNPDFSNPSNIRWSIRAHGILKGTSLD